MIIYYLNVEKLGNMIKWKSESIVRAPFVLMHNFPITAPYLRLWS